MSASSRFVYVTYILTTPEKLWEALTKPEFTRRYWAGTHHDTSFKPGSDWQLITPDGRVADSGKIIEIDPPRKLVVSWQHQILPDLTAEGHSRCTLELEPAGEAVKLTVTHEIDRENSRLIGAVGMGWPGIFSSLKTMLETGKALPGSDQWPKGI